MKIRDMLVVGSLAFAMSCSTEDLTSAVEDQLPEYQSCVIEDYNACAEGAGDDLTFRAACEGNGEYKEEVCPTEDVALKCEDVSAKSLKGDVYLYDQDQITLLSQLYGDDVCAGVSTLLQSVITE